MPTFPVLDIESLVQEKDKTRLSGAQSFVSDATDITDLSITPGALATEIVFDLVTAPTLRYLDWQFDFTFDVVTGENDTLDFDEGGGLLTATLTQGSYTMAALAAEIQTQLNAAGALTYVVTVDENNAFTISTSAQFDILDSAALWVQIGFDAAAGKSTYTGEDVERVSKLVTLKVSGDQTDVVTTKTVEVVSEHADRLFSTDDKLRKHEADILKYLPEGRATFKDVHRRAQTLILAWLDTEGFIDYFADKITLKRIGDISDVAEWATHMTLRLIFEGVQNAVKDVFEKKAKTYSEREDFYRKRTVVKIDLNKDGVADKYTERVDVRTCQVRRR
jgi:hypothetical protein